MNAALNGWWQIAQHDFAKLEGNNILPEVRSGLMQTLKDKLVPVGVLDEFKTAGVFVNWWQIIRYDLKTIISTGWSHVLIPDQYLIDAFFRDIADELFGLESKLAEAENQLEEAIAAVEYEADEEETVSASSLRKYLKSLIDDLKETKTSSAVKERKLCEEQHKAIVDAEDLKKKINATIRTKQFELDIKLSLKRHGAEAEKHETNLLLKQIASQLADLDSKNKEDKKRIKSLERDQKVLRERISRADAVMNEIGGQLGAQQAKNLILKKLYDVMQKEMVRYLNAEKSKTVHILDNLNDKYFVSLETLKRNQTNNESTFKDFIDQLGYLEMVSP